MQIIVAENAGFCFGVKRAADMAFQAAESSGVEKIVSLGPIIHSPQLVSRLEEKGVRVVHHVETIDSGKVIVRSHGVTADELDAITARGLEVVDATCPFVKKAQEYAALLAGEGYDVVIVGEKEHPEVQGIVSYARGASRQVHVVATPDEACELVQQRIGRLGIVAQTTQALENLQQIVDVFLGRVRELRIFNTICDATTVRQNEARDVAARVDLMLVVGGFNSANTTRLAQICAAIQPQTRHIETAAEIDPAWFRNVTTVGVTAGASTPRWIIDEVVAAVQALDE